MPAPIYADPLQQSRQRSQQQLTQQEQQVIQQLQQQQTWDLAANQTVDQQRAAYRQAMEQQQLADNQQLTAHAQAVLPAAQAQQAAAGAPVQALAPAEKTAKQLREERRHAQAARRRTPVGDAATYTMREQLNQFHHQQQQVCGGKWEKQLANPKELRGFFTLYGKHAPTAEKQRIDTANRALIDGLTSSDQTQRNQTLHGLVKDVLRIRLTKDMLQDEYLDSHLPEMLALSAKLSSMQQLTRNSAYHNFFNSVLPQQEKALLDCHLDEAIPLRTLLKTRLTAKGIRADGSYESDRNACLAARQQQAAKASRLQQRIQATDQQLTVHTGALMTTAGQQLQGQANQEKRKPAFQSLGLTGYLHAQDAQQLAELRELIARAPAQYAADRALFDRLYQRLYRATDAVSDMQLQIASAEQVLHEHGKDTAFGQIAAETAVSLQRQAAPLRRQLDAAAGLLRFLLGQQRELPYESRLLAAREQALAQVQRIEQDPQQEQADEALWASNPEALITRVQSRLDTLSLGTRPPQTAHLNDKNFFIQGRSGYFPPDGSQPMIERIRDTLISRFPQLNFDQSVTAPDGTVINGLVYLRMINNLVHISYPQTDEQDIMDMLTKLACATRYRRLLSLPQRTPEEQNELDTYTPARLAELTDTFQQGMQALKQFHLTYLRRTQQKYGRFQSQLHPGDLIRLCGIEYFTDTCLQQDCNQILKDGAKFMDLQNNADDQEYYALSHYMDSCALSMQAYFFSDPNAYSPDFNPDPVLIQFFNKNNPTVQEMLQAEKDAPGPHLNSAEMKAYEELVHRRYANKPDGLFGRFSN